MKKTTTFLILFITFCVNVQSQDWVWAKNFQNNSNAALYDSFIDSNKNSYIIAAFNSSTLNIDNLEFTNSSETPSNSNIKYTDAYLIKQDADGNIVFVKHFEGSKYEYLSSITYDGNNNFYVTGNYNGTITLGSDIYETQNNESKSFIAKLDLDGNILWSKSIDYHGNSILKYKDGFLYLTGIHSGNTYTYDNLVTPSANYIAVVDYMDKIFIAKLDLSGNAIWLKSSTYNGTSNIQNSHRLGTQNKALTIDNNGNVYVAGLFFCPSTTFGTQTINKTASTNNSNLFIAKYDASGNFGWASTATTSSVSTSTVNDIQADALNNIYLTGTVYNSAANFNGTSISFPGNAGSYLVKYNATGTVSWVKGGKISPDAQPSNNLGSNAFDKIYIDANNNIYVSGVFYGYINFGNNYVIQNPDFTSNLFSVKFDTNGIASDFLKIAEVAQTREVRILDITGDTYYYSGKINDVALTLGTITMENTTSGQTYIAKRDATLSVGEFPKVASMVYPNPATSIVNLSNYEENTVCTIFDITGKKVKEITLNEPFFSVEDLAKGVYILQLQSESSKESLKLVKK